MKITVVCPDCKSRLEILARTGGDLIKCGLCDRLIALAISEKIRSDSEVDCCPVCQGVELYSRKDFDPKIGLTVIIVGALISGVFYWFRLDLIAYSVLGIAALLDLVVYSRLRDLSVCYRCHAEFRGNYRRTAPLFDLHTADELELEWARRLGKQ